MTQLEKLNRYMAIGYSSNMHVDAASIDDARRLAREAGWKPEQVDSLEMIEENIHNIETTDEYFERIIKEQQENII